MLTQNQYMVNIHKNKNRRNQKICEKNIRLQHDHQNIKYKDRLSIELEKNKYKPNNR